MFHNNFHNKGNLTIGNDTEFDDVDFYGLELKGNVPLTAEIRAFLESKGNTVSQTNGKIIFQGNILNTFSPSEVATFLTQGNQAAPKPAAKPAPHI